jgi:hypothetical protein
MKINNIITKNLMLILAISMSMGGCQKMTHPALGNYPKDANAPGGPLKFYAAMDGGNVDSIRANFGIDTKVTYVQGVSGKAMQAGADGYIVYPSANDFKKSSSFALSFWVKKAGPNIAGGGTSFAFGLSTTKDIWTHMDMFLEFEDAGNPSSADSAACKFYLNDQWFEFVKTGSADKRLPKVLDGQWHQLAFSFDGTSSTLTTYIDGAAYTNLPAGFGKFTNNGGSVDFSSIAGLVVGAAGHYAIGKTPDSWMGDFNGAIDQFRMYGVALSATEVSALYTQKQ